MTKIGRFPRGFSLVDFPAVGFLGLLKTFKTLVINLYLMTVVIHSKQTMAITP